MGICLYLGGSWVLFGSFDYPEAVVLSGGSLSFNCPFHPFDINHF
jgi:hypothetical protein